MERRGRRSNDRQTGERDGKSRQRSDRNRSERPRNERSKRENRSGDYQGGEKRGPQQGEKSRSDRPFSKRGDGGSFSRDNNNENPYKSDREERGSGRGEKRDERSQERDGRGNRGASRGEGRGQRGESRGAQRSERKWDDRPRGEKKSEYGRSKSSYGKRGEEKRSENPIPREESNKDGIRLNKYIAHGGICSRREADDLIKTGAVTVNGKLVIEMGYKVLPSDVVNIDGTSIKPEKKHYVLLNKPKGFITTTDDPHDRKTVMTLVDKACKERIYPVGRLDRNTSGLLLFTNDGDMAKRLTHPKYNIKKLYHAVLDKKISKNELNQLLEGVTLEDGFVKADEISYVGNGEDATQVGIALHSGKNRIVRRIFQHLGYEVVKLDRVLFAGLTKKDLPRGRWRHLSEKELAFLQMK